MPSVIAEITVSNGDKGLTNHHITIALDGGAILGPFNATWSKEMVSDVRELVREYEAFMQGEPQKRFRFHLHDQAHSVSHTLVLDFQRVTAIYDHVDLVEGRG